MKMNRLSIAFLLYSSMAFSQAVDQKRKDIDLLVSKMTLEEKVGQMTQLTLDYVCKGAAFDENKEMLKPNPNGNRCCMAP